MLTDSDSPTVGSEAPVAAETYVSPAAQSAGRLDEVTLGEDYGSQHDKHNWFTPK